MKRAYLDGEQRRDVEVQPAGAGAFEVLVDGERVTVAIVPLGEGCYRLESEAGATVACVTLDGKRRFVTLEGRDYVFEQTTAAARRAHGSDPGSGEIRMPMPGLVVRVEVKAGDRVSRGQPLVVVEAMKMEQTLRAPREGVVKRLAAEAGKLMDAGALLVEVAEAE